MNIAASVEWLGSGAEFDLSLALTSVPLPAHGRVALAPSVAVNSGWPLLNGWDAVGFNALAVQRLAIGGRVRLTEELGLRWSAGIARAEMLGPIRDYSRGFDQRAISLALTRGPWSGGLTGRLTRPRPVTGLSSEIDSIDLEVQWLTPWDAALSFGAENLILRESALQPMIPTTPAPPTPARTPFVRYRQLF